MVIRSEVPASIEGAEVLVTGQDIKPSGRPKKISASSNIVFPLTVKTRGEGTIQKEHNPKQAPFKAYSSLERGDKIEGKSLWGFSSNPISIGDIRVGGCARTGSHPGQEIMLYGTCFLELILGWRGYAIAKHPKDVLLT
jgi:hypothetical protein